MNKKTVMKYAGIIGMLVIHMTVYAQKTVMKTENRTTPANYYLKQDSGNAVADTAKSNNTAQLKWKDFFTDPYLVALIDTALHNNQELNIVLQEINAAKSEIKARKGEYLPFVGIGAEAGMDKVGRYTRNGALEANNDIKPGTKFPEPYTDIAFGAYASWELDIWGKLRNAKKAAVYKYLSSVEGKNFMVTNLIAEIANSYYELMALDNQLEILERNIAIQTNALAIVKMEKAAAKVTELAVRKFEAEVYKNQSTIYNIKQKITETENRINFLVGGFPQQVQRSKEPFENIIPQVIQAGIPSQLLSNRPDIKQAELVLASARLDVKSAKARLYPSLGISAAIGMQSYNTASLLKTPESFLYSLAGELVAPLINRNAIKAGITLANARQVQAVYSFERNILNAYVEVSNQLAMIDNLQKSYDLKEKQVQALTRSIEISTVLFKSARADYMEILMTQRDALESKFELVETRMQQMNAMVNVYRALGGGWN